MRKHTGWAAWLAWYSVFGCFVAGFWLGPRVFCPARQAVAKAVGGAGLAQVFADRNGWDVRPDARRPRELVFLVNPTRRPVVPELTFLRTADRGWDGIVRIEAVVTPAGVVDANGGFVWRGWWFYGDAEMLAGIRRLLP
jgi:hypothetical protein